MRPHIIVTALLFLGVTANAFAHHSATALYDLTAPPVKITGTLKQVRWINPHIRIVIEPDDSSQFPEAWQFESQPPQWYRRVGVSRAKFQNAVGKPVTVIGGRARDGRAFGIMLKMIFPDGSVFEMVLDSIEGQE